MLCVQHPVAHSRLWSVYSSMVIRDLTLRSAASFGSFHLIRLLYDEYMFYLVEHKVAGATGETPVAVMGEVRQVCKHTNFIRYLSSSSYTCTECSSPCWGDLVLTTVLSSVFDIPSFKL